MVKSKLTKEQARFIWQMEVDLPSNKFKGTTKQITQAQNILDERNQMFIQYKIEKDDFWDDVWETTEINR